ncbi:DUF2812 domain-containing protein [Paenibacillus puldeungensis]|uniref:DUF2812 domain-containing protein n=1 Tax=Paenibacillus puldeungensis TaxID=696536 RepID=A0ABW3RZV0_9BACL
MSQKKTVLLSAFRHVIPADYEQWFENLAAQGWHPQHIGQWSSIVMRFTKGNPERYSYVVDLQAVPRKDYKPTYEEFGWEFVGQMASAYVWRKKYADKRPESFTDQEQLNERNKRFIWAISFSFIIFLLIALVLAVLLLVNLEFMNLSDDVQFAAGLLLSGGAAIYLGLTMRKIKKSMKE